MIGEEIAVQPHPRRRDVELAAEEISEVREQLGVRVRDLERVPTLRSFRPVQHASGGIRIAALVRETSSLVLIRPSHRSSALCLLRARDCAAPLASIVEGASLVRRQDDVANPLARGALRHADERCHLANREAGRTKLASLSSFICFHNRQRTDSLGRQ
jgi:hypothetical protein